jgi:membrane-associated protease RseP (regulator of RpoE activity)
MTDPNEGEPVFSYQSFLQKQFDAVAALRAEVESVIRLADIHTSDRGDSVVFIGRLLNSAEDAYNILKDRFQRLGYTALLRREKNGNDVVIAQRGVIPFTRSNPLINAALLFITILTTMFAGASFAQVNLLRVIPNAITNGNWAALMSALASGVPFAITLLLILGVHEMGHYIVGRLHGVNVTLPYFIPVPFGLGTMGAFIQLKSPVENRKALFDVGLAGPVAGFIVALPLMIVGLFMSEVVFAGDVGRLGSSLLLRWLIDLIHPRTAGYAVALHPVAIAAWFGILITGINLLPMGQLDGGHVAYAVLGKAAHTLAFIAFGTMIIAGFTVWSGWFTWAFFAIITGLRHSSPLNDITPLDPVRKLIGFATLIWFLLIITPRPF